MRDVTAGVLLLFGLARCTSYEVTEIDLASKAAGAKSAIVAVETERDLRVSALDLGAEPVPALPTLEADDRVEMIISARFFGESLAELEFPKPGPLAPGDGPPLPQRPNARDHFLRVGGAGDEDWNDGALGPRAAAFRSPDLPPELPCRDFEVVASHPVGPDSTINRTPIRQAARLGSDGLALQGSSRLFRVNEDGVRLLNETMPDFDTHFSGGIGDFASWQDRVIFRRCVSGTPALFALAADETVSAVPTEGLPSCPSALVSFQDRLFALVGLDTVYGLGSGEDTWSMAATFDGEIDPGSFIAYGPDGFAGMRETGDSEDPRYTARVADSSGRTSMNLPVPPRVSFTVSKPTAMNDRALFVLTAHLYEAEFYAGSMGRPFERIATRGSNLLFATSSFEGVLLATGFYGPLIQVAEERPLAQCEDATVVPSSTMEFLVDLGGGRFLLAGTSNQAPIASSPRPEPQRLTIIRAKPR